MNSSQNDELAVRIQGTVGQQRHGIDDEALNRRIGERLSGAKARQCLPEVANARRDSTRTSAIQAIQVSLQTSAATA